MRLIEKAENTAPGGSWLTRARKRAGVVGSAVGDAHAQLDHHRVVEQPVADQLLHLHQVPGVEDLELGAHAQLLHPLGHRPQHRRAVDHHVVAAGGEVHRAAVERADLRHEQLDVGQPLGGAGQVGAVLGEGSGASSPPSTRSPPMPAVRLRTTSTPEERMRSTTSLYR